MLSVDLRKVLTFLLQKMTEESQRPTIRPRCPLKDIELIVLPIFFRLQDIHYRAKSEALDNIYSLLKQNIKSCYAKQQRQREQ